jgi:hypothetical protein
MKFSSVLVATFASQASAFSSPQVSYKITTSRSAATLEAPEEVADAPILGSISTSMDVEKNWPVEEFVKDSDRVMP